MIKEGITMIHKSLTGGYRREMGIRMIPLNGADDRRGAGLILTGEGGGARLDV